MECFPEAAELDDKHDHLFLERRAVQFSKWDYGVVAACVSSHCVLCMSRS